MLPFRTKPFLGLLGLAVLVTQSAALLETSQNGTHITLSTERFSVALAKSSGHIMDMQLDGEDLLGPTSGSVGQGPYLDCSCVPSGFWTPGSTAELQLIEDVDSTGTAYGGIAMTDTYASTNQTLSQYLFLRDGETGLHAFSRVTYFNADTPFLRSLGELRTLFRPNTGLWTHFSTSDGNYGPLPLAETLAGAPSVQDATWYVGDATDDPYVREYSDYFTKYTLAESWRDHDVHGMFGDGSGSSDGSTFGAWLVHNTRETYYGGPLHADLVVDGIVYNYLVSGHYGAPMPNITHGFDRTWGPQFYYFNKGDPSTTLGELRADAARFADPEWNAEFYDSVAKYVPNIIPGTRRTTLEGTVSLPEGAQRPIIVLSENRQDFQLNVFNTTSLQYWAEVSADGAFSIPRVVEGTYRVTIYADGIFGWFIQDDVQISSSSSSPMPSGSKDQSFQYTWEEESAGTEIWRIGVPDKSAGEYLHGYAPDASKPLAPEQYRIYFGAYDFVSDFPSGVRFEVGGDDGGSDPAVDLNYVHWSVFGGEGNYVRPTPYYDNVNNWTVAFGLDEAQLSGATTATLTVQLAGVRTANGNSKWEVVEGPYSSLPWTLGVNGVWEETWVIPYWRSGSCGVRSAVTCQNVERKFVFDASYLAARNEFVLSLPFNATSVETAVLPNGLYVQYDALRLELDGVGEDE